MNAGLKPGEHDVQLLNVTKHERDVLAASAHLHSATVAYLDARRVREEAWQQYQQRDEQETASGRSYSAARERMLLTVGGVTCPHCGEYVDAPTSHEDQVEKKVVDDRVVASTTTFSCAKRG